MTSPQLDSELTAIIALRVQCCRKTPLALQPPRNLVAAVDRIYARRTADYDGARRWSTENLRIQRLF